ncbi:hypothetical protein OIU84_029748 [Salix udensis]|uniref:Uncharacterized protein n=1 Tax=Salix udensis TaxID=889485 RepID=A0AAD6KA05_9ROSI|nr:hypothetical protein OIU84_029748 [Salix udensis]
MGMQDPMVFEAATVAPARQALPNKLTSTRQPDVVAATVDVWQPVLRKHTSNRKPKSGMGILPGLALGLAFGKDIVASKEKMAEAIENVSTTNGLMASGSIAAGSSMVEAVSNASGGTGMKGLSMGCAGYFGC